MPDELDNGPVSERLVKAVRILNENYILMKKKYVEYHSNANICWTLIKYRTILTHNKYTCQHISISHQNIDFPKTENTRTYT